MTEGATFLTTCHCSDIVYAMTAPQFDFEVKAKGRAVLPAGLRTACGFEPGTRLHARPTGPGQAVVETTDAILNRIWSANISVDTDGVDTVKAWRSEEAAQTAPSEPEALPGEELTEVGRATLRALGLS
jgi:bifunctional DNA-binding transcriptional regulator/antitoxin component of YhaV-PrlF toxin-antitoxin module